MTPPPSPAGSATQVPALLALATQRSNFILMNALPVADWIDWLRGGREAPDDTAPVNFIRFNYGGRTFLASGDALAQHYAPRWWLEGVFDLPFHQLRSRRRWAGSALRLDWFVMEEKPAAAFLNALAAMIRSGPSDLPESLELPAGDIEGFSVADRDTDARAAREDYDYALFRDGLALLGSPPPRRITGVCSWHPKQGLAGATA